MVANIIQSNFGVLANIDLLVVGITVAVTLILGYIVFFNDQKSITNRSFLLFLLITVLYSIANYLQYHIANITYSLWWLRLVIFFSVWHAFSVYQLFFVFPRTSVTFPRWYTRGIVPAVAITALLTLTPAVFSRVNQVTMDGQIGSVINGPGIIVFGLVVGSLVLSALYLLGRKTLFAKGIERKQFKLIAIGTFTTFGLLLYFNFFMPAFRDNTEFVSLAPIFMLPFVLFTFYATIRHHLLNVKVISTELLTLVLAIITFLEVIFSKDPLLLIFRVGIFILVLVFGILLIRSVRREVEQRVELERLARELKEANLKLEDISKFKTQLLSLASHQIKSPLAAIKGFASILLEGLYGPVDGKVRETLEKMKRSADGLVELINTLLDVRKVEEGRMEYRFAKVDIVKLIRETVEELEPLAGQRKLEFGFDTTLAEVWISADGQKLRQVLQNLIDNSIKYTPKGFVRVELKTENTTVVFSVSDSGLGVPQELIPHLFEEFIREERVRTQVMGTGLGLYIARKIVEAHNGRIWVESKGVNQGATFYVALKKAA